MSFKRLTAWLLLTLVIFIIVPASGHATDTLFPEFAVLKTNVDFWTDIYTHYPTTKAVVHDNLHLNIVYDVIDLVPGDHPGAQKINRRRMKSASQKYARILRQLADDPDTADAECRRVATLFQANPDAQRHAHHRVRCQIGQQDRFRAGLIRSGVCIDQMRDILKSYGVPEDLAYLPHVESSFDLSATSKFGAAGMWQFTRSTGRRFLTVDDVLDERLDPIAATHGAAQLLKENYEKLGSWPLAITAYNHGAAGMQRAKAAHGDYPRIFTAYTGRTFKFASRNFYSEFLAARRIASNYQRYFGDLNLATPVQRRSMRLEAFVAFADLCRHLGLDPDAIRAVNPALRPSVVRGQKYLPANYRLNLPGRIQSEETNQLAQIPESICRPAQKPSRFYTVQRGDTAGKIARMHRVDLDDLILANNLDRRATVYLRQTLRIPQPGEMIARLQTPRADDLKEAVEDLAATMPATGTRIILAAIPVETDSLKYRRPEPAPADLLAMDAARTSNTPPRSDHSPWRAGATVAPSLFSVVSFEHARLQPAEIICVELEEDFIRHAGNNGSPFAEICRLDEIPTWQTTTPTADLASPDKLSLVDRTWTSAPDA